MISIGTSGFQYPEWKGKFYPKDLSTAKMLPYYAERFATTEINYSFYRIPTVKTLAGWSESTPRSFRFSFKAPKQITHIQKLNKTGSIVSAFSEVLATLNGKLGLVLFQLPPYLKKDVTLLKDFIDSLPAGLNRAFEFRHESWFDDTVFACLKSGKSSLCIADTDDLSTPVVFTGVHAYFRLRREDYTRKDIARWAAVIGEETAQMKQVYVYFKHEETGSGPKFARELQKHLGLVKE
jgi:uncharacterized protein YecE (DUF72 family)